MMAFSTRIQNLLKRKFVQDTIALQIGKIGVVGMSMLWSVILWRLMSPADYGVWTLVQSFAGTWALLNLLGMIPATNTRLALAIGKEDHPEIKRILAVYIQLTLLQYGALILLMVIISPLLAINIYGSPRIGTLAIWLMVALLGDALYNLVVVSLQSRRSMHALAVLLNVNQLVLMICSIIALIVAPQAESLVIARVVYSYLMVVIAWIAYGRLLETGTTRFPPLREVLALVPKVSPRPYLRFGFALAVDKNLAMLYQQLPLLMVGALAGEAEAGYLGLALNGMVMMSVLTSAIFDNMQTVVPQAIGRGDYARLWRNFTRILATLLIGGIVVYTLMALLARPLIPLVLGEKWQPAIPALITLCLYGVVTMTGGIFGPLYRGFHLMKQALLTKILPLIIIVPLGVLMINDAGAVGGAWLINLLYLSSTALTAAFTLPVLWRKKQEATRNG